MNINHGGYSSQYSFFRLSPSKICHIYTKHATVKRPKSKGSHGQPESYSNSTHANTTCVLASPSDVLKCSWRHREPTLLLVNGKQKEIKSYLFCFILESVVVRSEMEVVLRCENDVKFDALTVVDFTTGSPSSKYEHRRASASIGIVA